MSLGRLVRLCATLTPWLCAAAHAALLDARIAMEPSRPFVGQDFQLVVEVAAEPGAELELQSVIGLPGPDAIGFGPLEAAGPRRQEKAEDGATLEWHRYRATGRARSPIAVTARCIVVANVIRRTGNRFFSSITSNLERFRIPDFDLDIRALPEPPPGTPLSEGGFPAIGRFRVPVSAQPETAAAGAVVTLTATAEGDGDLNGVSPLPPDFSGADVRVYPVQEVSRGPRRVVVRQVIVPLSTNDVAVGAFALPYFDAEEGAYRRAESEAFVLRVAPASEAEEETTLKTLVPETLAPGTAEPSGETASDALQDDLWRVAPWAIALLAAVLAAAGLPRRMRFGFRLPLALLLGLAAGYGAFALLSRGSGTGRQTVPAACEMRLAPSPSARSLGWIPAETDAEVLERSGNWLRIRVRDRTGWIDGRTFQTTPPGP